MPPVRSHGPAAPQQNDRQGIVSDLRSLLRLPQRALDVRRARTSRSDSSWRPTMMANSARDPYWQAGVRRETIDHPGVAKRRSRTSARSATCRWRAIESKFEGREGEVFAHLDFDSDDRMDQLAQDGVSCSLCHQIRKEKLGTRESFVGGFVDRHDQEARPSARSIGPFKIENGREPHHAHVVGRLRPDRGRAHPAVRAVRHLSHADHEGARTERRR